MPIKKNGDVAFLKGLCKELICRDEQGESVLDHEFIQQYCTNYTAFADDLKNTSWQSIVDASGLTQAQIKQAADIACNSKKTICCWAMGMTQHKNAVANIQLMTNFLMLQGNLGKPGAGVCPVRGHSNVQGDRTMGIYEKPSDQFLDSLQNEFHFAPPRKHGVDAIDSIHQMVNKQIAVFFALGGNFYRATPDHDATRRALGNCELTVQVSTKLNQSHLYTGKTAIILPCLGRTEVDVRAGKPQTITVENSMGVVQTSRGKLPPAARTLKSEVAIVAELAATTLRDSDIDWMALANDYASIREHIARVIPGFEDFNQRLKDEQEFVLPNAVRDQREFNTATNKANFVVNPITPISLGKDHLLMMTIRSHDQFNTTVYTDNDRYRGIHGGRHVIFVNASDINRLGLKAGQTVNITSHWTDEPDRIVEGFQIVEYAIPKGCVAAYYPETNNLIPLSSVADRSNTPAYKSVVVSLTPIDS